MNATAIWTAIDGQFSTFSADTVFLRQLIAHSLLFGGTLAVYLFSKNANWLPRLGTPCQVITGFFFLSQKRPHVHSTVLSTMYTLAGVWAVLCWVFRARWKDNGHFAVLSPAWTSASKTSWFVWRSTTLNFLTRAAMHTLLNAVLCALPLHIASSHSGKSLSWLEKGSVWLWIMSFLGLATADMMISSAGRHTVIQREVFEFCRHPHQLFNIGVWLSYVLFATSSLSFTVADIGSWLGLFGLLVFLAINAKSGAWISEARQLQANREEYEEYCERVPRWPDWAGLAGFRDGQADGGSSPMSRRRPSALSNNRSGRSGQVTPSTPATPVTPVSPVGRDSPDESPIPPTRAVNVSRASAAPRRRSTSTPRTTTPRKVPASTASPRTTPKRAPSRSSSRRSAKKTPSRASSRKSAKRTPSTGSRAKRTSSRRSTASATPSRSESTASRRSSRLRTPVQRFAPMLS